MKRRKVTLLVAVMLAMLTMAVAPAFADNNDVDCHNRPGPFIRCDGERFVRVDRADDLFGDNNNNFAFSPFFFGCWVWDGHEWDWEC